MKVILLAPTPPPSGGIAGWTVRMQNANLKNGWSVEVVDEKLIGGRQVFGKNKRNFLIEVKRSLNIWRQLIRALKNKKAQVVHSCIPASTTAMLREYICAIITKLARKKFIIHYRCTLSNMVSTKASKFVFRKLTNISDLAIVLNTESLEFINKHTKTVAVVIPNFIEEEAIVRQGSKTIKQSVERVLYVGGVIESKGCIDIINVAKDFPEIQFHFVGNVEKKIMDMVKPSNVVLLGEKNKLEVKKELEDADLFIFVTYFLGEGFSNALAEAMANGLPCIVSDWAANKDMIEDKGGEVVPVKNVESIVIALEKLIGNKVLRLEQSTWNINKVRTHYIDKVVTNMYVDEYEKLIR